MMICSDTVVLIADLPKNKLRVSENTRADSTFTSTSTVSTLLVE